VRGLVELLLESERDARPRKRLEVVAGEVARIERIVREYLSFARPLSSIEPAAMDLGVIALDVTRALDAFALRKGVALTASGDVLPLTADARRMKECVLNLCLNAIEATPAGGEVRVSWRRVGGDGQVIVRDSGPGLDADALAKLGTAFYTTRDGGTGLGVRLARQAAEQHGGSLTYTSAVGEGTVATLSIPCETRPRDAHDPAL
jgi:signal transduction histidine kinase